MFKNLNECITELCTQKDWTKNNIKDNIFELIRSKNVTVKLIHNIPFMLVYHIDLKKLMNSKVKECLLFIVGHLPLSEHAKQLDYLNTIQTLLIHESLVMSNHLLFFVKTPEKIQKDYKLCFKNFIFNNVEKLKDVLQSGTNTKIINLLSECQPQMVFSPFKYLGPCPPELFVGREDLITYIIDGNDHGYAITGGRRVGKTSLLLRIMYEIANGRKCLSFNKEKNGYEKKSLDCCYVDCINLYSLQDIYNEICRKMNPKLIYTEKNKALNIRKIVQRTSALKNKKLLLMFDEMDDFMEMASERDNDALIFAQELQSIANQGLIKFVISGFRKVSNLIKDSKHPFYNLCKGLYVNVLKKDDITKMLGMSIIRKNFNIEHENISDVADMIFKVSGGYPSVVQFIADQLVKKKHNEMITPDTIQKIMDSKETKDFVLETVIMNTNQFERLICIIAAKELSNITIDTVKKSLDDNGVKAKNKEFDIEKEVYSSLQNLCNNCILYDYGEKYSFLYPLIPSIIRKNLINSIPGLKNDIYIQMMM